MSGIRTVLTGREIRLMHDAVLMRFRGLASAQAPGFLKERINGLLGGVELKLDCSTATDAVVFRTAGELLSPLARAHLFSDGNKRTAVLSALLFLLRSGHDVSATTDAGKDFRLWRLMPRWALSQERRRPGFSKIFPLTVQLRQRPATQ